MFKKIFLLFLFSLTQIISLQSHAIDTEISKIRMKKIAEIIRRYTNANEKLSDPYVREAIFDEVDKDLVLEPVAKANDQSVKEIAKIVRKKVLKRFPDSIKTIKEKATKTANKKFKIAKKLDPVSVDVQKGRTSYNVSGIYYGHGIGGTSVRIGDNPPIAYFDLNKISRAKFDKVYCERVKRNYIDDKVRSYYRKKNTYTNQLFSEIRAKISTENESLGYIYAWSKWRTPKNVTEYLIQKIDSTLKKRTDIVASNTSDDEQELDKPTDVETDEAKGKEGLIKEADTDINSEKLKIAKIRRAVEERQLVISGSQYGIDADQGYNKGDKRVIWGMRQENVNLLFKDEPDVSIGDNSTTITYSNGAIQSVTLHFVNGLFYKTDVAYSIGPKEGMMMLWQQLNEKYGESIESKSMTEENIAKEKRLVAIKSPCPPDKKGKETHKFKNGKCTKCKIKQHDIHPPALPLAQTFTWNGLVTNAILNVRLNSNRSSFDNFNLIKENKEIEKTQSELVDNAKKRQDEEEKQIELEKYRKSLE